MIPEIIFTYWEGDQLSLLHYYTIYSLHKYNPLLNIIIYTDKNPTNILKEWNTNEHSINIKKKVSLSKLIDINPKKILLKPINFQKEYKFENNISIVFKADFIRIAKLYEHGGIWFDMDIFFSNPIPDFFFKEDLDSYIFIYDNIIATGLLASKPKTFYLEELYNRSLEIIKNKNLSSYQKIGPIIWIEEYKKLNQTNKNKIKILDNNLVYPFLWNDLYNIFKNPKSKIYKNTFGLHWYNGAPLAKEFINNFDENNINKNNSLIEKLIFNLTNKDNNLQIQESDYIYSDNLEDNNEELFKKLFNEFLDDSDKYKDKNIEEIIIEFQNSNNLEKIQYENYNKILNSNNSIVIKFIIPKKLLKTKVLTFFKCWKNGYCLNDSGTKLPKNIKKILLKKI
jgi:mannosyltransferase OCH1-like enzyme